MDKIKIQYKMEKETELGLFTDYVYFSVKEWDKISPDDLEKIVNERADLWVSQRQQIENNPPVITEEDLLKEKEELIKKVSEIEGRLEEIVNKE